MEITRKRNPIVNVDNILYRPFDPINDPERIYIFRQEVEELDHDNAPISLEKIKAQMLIPGHEPVRDRVVACLQEKPDSVLAYSSLWPTHEEADVQIVVHPKNRRQGIGTQLLKRLLILANELGVRTLNGYALHTNAGGNGFLIKNGFLHQGAYTELRSEELTAARSCALPANFKMKTFTEVMNPVVMAEAMNEAYRGLWGHHEGIPEQVAEWVSIYPDEYRFILFDTQGQLAGVCCTRKDNERTAETGHSTAYIDAPGLLPTYRSLDLYRGFLCAVHAILLSRGALRSDMESWGDQDENLAAYQDLGYKILRKTIAYKLIR